VSVSRRRILSWLYGVGWLIAVIFLADAVFVRLDMKDVEWLLRATPEPARSAYIEFVLSVPSGYLNHRKNKIQVLKALRENYENGSGDIPFDEAQVITLVDPRYSVKEADEATADRPAALFLASTGDPGLVERAFEKYSRDVNAANNIRYWFQRFAEERPEAYARVQPVVERYDAIVRARFGAEYNY